MHRSGRGVVTSSENDGLGLDIKEPTDRQKARTRGWRLQGSGGDRRRRSRSGERLKSDGVIEYRDNAQTNKGLYTPRSKEADFRRFTRSHPKTTINIHEELKEGKGRKRRARSGERLKSEGGNAYRDNAHYPWGYTRLGPRGRLSQVYTTTRRQRSTQEGL